MYTVDWSNIKFRASSWGSLMTDPKTKADKEAGILSVTCQKELIKIYTLLKYGRKKEVVTAKMDKGVQGEEESIKLFSLVEKRLYQKNLVQLENDFFTGHPDVSDNEIILKANEIWDIKTRWELDSFLPKLNEEADTGEDYQLQCYYDLTGAKSGGIANTLIDCPINILMDEQRKLLYAMSGIAATEESPEYIEAAAELEKLLTFKDIDYRERVIKQPVMRDDALIEKMKAKVPIMRQWLADFEKKHMAQYPK